MDNNIVFKLNAFSQHNLFTTLNKVLSETRSAYSIDKETIGSILETEACPTLTAFWQNLLNYIIFDVSFEGAYPQNLVIPNICMRYKKEDIDISIRASTKDCIAIQKFYQGVRITSTHNIDDTVCLEIARIIRELSDLIIALVPLSTPDSNIPMCSVLPCA